MYYFFGKTGYSKKKRVKFLTIFITFWIMLRKKVEYDPYVR